MQEYRILRTPGADAYHVCLEGGEEYDDLNALLYEMAQGVDELWVLGRDEVSADVPDIRGCIYNEPPIVVAFRVGAYVGYSGIV